MILSLSGEISIELFEYLISQYNPKEKNIIYLSSTGGSTYAQDAIIHFINFNKDVFHIVGYGELQSAAFNIFFKSKCSKEILPDTIGMSHFSWTEVVINETGKGTTDYDKFSMETMKLSKEKTIEFLKHIGLNNKELSKIKKGQDVFFSYTRMQELLKFGTEE